MRARSGRPDHRRWLRNLELVHFEATSPACPTGCRTAWSYARAPGPLATRPPALGYQEASTPLLARDPLYASSGHLEHFAGNHVLCQAARTIAWV